MSVPEEFIPDSPLPQLKKTAIVFDIDGTLTLPYPVARLDWNDTELCNRLMEGHQPEWRLISMMNHFYRQGHFHIILATGRPEMYREVTKRWLERHKALYHGLGMRPSYKLDAHDSDIKIQMLEEMREKFDVWFWVEDRKSVTEALRKAGVMVLQCAEGDY